MKLRYDLSEHIVDVRLREPNTGPRVTTLVCERSELLLDGRNRCLGVEIVVSEDELAEPDLWWSDELLTRLRQPVQIRWAPGEAVSRRVQEVYADIDEEGIYSVEIMLFLQNWSVDFGLLRRAGESS